MTKPDMDARNDHTCYGPLISPDLMDKCVACVSNVLTAQLRAALDTNDRLLRNDPGDVAEAYRAGFVDGQLGDVPHGESGSFRYETRLRAMQAENERLRAGLLWALNDIADTAMDVPGSELWDWEKMDELRRLATNDQP